VESTPSSGGASSDTYAGHVRDPGKAVNVDKVRQQLKHRLGMQMPERDHESYWTGTTGHGTHVRQTSRCTAYAPQMYGARSVVVARYTGTMLMGIFMD